MKVKITRVPISNMLYAEGGQFAGLHTNGADFQNPGGFREINAGSSHELNGNQGVPQGVDSNGTPNLVEENETVYNDYVFSDRLTVPTRKELDAELKSLPEKDGGRSQRGWEIRVLKKFAGMTYADASKKAYKEVEERPNDAISKRGVDAILGVLANSQEKQRAIEKAEEEADQIKQMSDQEFAQQQQQQEEQEAMQQQAMEQQMAQQQQAQQQQQMSPEEQAMMQQQAMQQQQMQQQPQMANGGHLFEDGGQLQKQMQIASLYYQYLQQSNNADKIKAIQQTLSQYTQQIQQLPQEQQQAAIQQAQMQCLYEAATQDQDFINQMNQSQQQEAIYAEGGNMEQSQEQDQSFMDQENPEDLSTTQLNQTIDQIIQYAKNNRLRDIVKEGRKAKRGSREDKEEFVEDAIVDIQEIEEQKQQEQQMQEEQQMQDQQQLQEQQAAEQAQQAQAMQMQEQAIQQQVMQQQQANPEQMAAQELNAQMNGQQFAMGGSMNTNNPNSGNFVEGNKRFDGDPLNKFNQLSNRQKKKLLQAVQNFLQQRGFSRMKQNDFNSILEEQASILSSEDKNTRRNFNWDDISKNITNKNSLLYQYGRSNRVNNQISYDLSDKQIYTPGNSGKYNYQYRDNAGNIINDDQLYSPQLIKNNLSYNQGSFTINEKTVDPEEFFTADNGFFDYKNTRDWSKLGYYSKNENGDKIWNDVDKESQNESGNKPNTYVPLNEWWKKQSYYKNIDEYENSDDYINDYLDFVDAIKNKDIGALQRLYDLGQISQGSDNNKSTGNRYFKESADRDNLSIDDIKTVEVDGFDKRVIGDHYLPFDYQENNQYYQDDKGNLISEITYKENPQKYNSYKKLDNKGLTRDQRIKAVRAARNKYPGQYGHDDTDLLYEAKFDNNPAQAYLYSPELRSATRYALVNGDGKYIDQNGNETDNPIYLNYDPNEQNNPYSLYNNGASIGENQNIGGVNVNTIGVVAPKSSMNLIKVGNDYRLLSDDDINSGRFTQLQGDELKNLPNFNNGLIGSQNNVNYYKLNQDYENSDDDYIDINTGEQISKPYLNSANNNIGGNPQMPTPSFWPYALAGLGQLGALAYNIARPDRSGGQDLLSIDITPNTASPEYATQFLRKRHIFDPNIALNEQTAKTNRSDNLLANLSGGNRGNAQANIIANDYNYLLGSGDLAVKGQMMNADQDLKEAQYLSQYMELPNKEAANRFAMFNAQQMQDAAKMDLERKRAAYAMIDADQKDRELGISSAMSGFGQLGYNFGKDSDMRNLLGWQAYVTGNPGLSVKGYKPTPSANGGKIRTRRRKGLTF